MGFMMKFREYILAEVVIIQFKTVSILYTLENAAESYIQNSFAS